ncbi:VWA domain-containing protein [Gilvimarinus chinensis]|uniref:VWA domain-containing protein n=1 Tax=Gilvimarinus chinensis TaxID=396005 RepID=UPI00037CD391|nr:VWA domain-containing protein [Gilvimarinus chinensis]
MANSLIRVSVLLWAAFFCFHSHAQSPSPSAALVDADVRLLVDISGSMKNTDPDNLRQPALELMVKLLSESAYGGVWTFGEQVNMLVPFSRSDEDWQRRALEQTSRINSVGLFTNIGEVLHRATEVPAKTSSADVILLTDGKIDVDKNAGVNSRERNRVLSELLPEIAEKNFRLHTIALSADADSELLQQLSRTTDGHHLVAKNADELMQAYLQIFDQAVPAKRLPLENNRFLVDDQVNEFTALVFRAPTAEPTQLLMPDGKALSASSHGDNTQWYSADGYDLITITNPAAGRWQLKAQESAQNRVTVVSDLQLYVESLPNNLLAGNALTLAYALQEKGNNLTDADFLDLITAEIVVMNVTRDVSWNLALTDQPDKATGVFTHELPTFNERGQYRLRLRVDGKTFAREFQHQLQVGSMFAVQLDKAVQSSQVKYTLNVKTDSEFVNTDKTSVVAHVKHSSGESELRALKKVSDTQWQLTLTPAKPMRTLIELNASGELTDGREFNEVLPSQYVQFPQEGDPLVVQEDSELAMLKQQIETERAALANEERLADTVAKTPAAKSQTSSPVSESQDDKQEAGFESGPDSAEETDEGGINWPMIAAITLGNLLLIGGLYWAYRRFSAKDVQSELDEIEQQLQAAPNEPSGQATEQQKKEAVALDDDNSVSVLDSLDESSLPMDDFSFDDESDKK